MADLARARTPLTFLNFVRFRTAAAAMATAPRAC